MRHRILLLLAGLLVTGLIAAGCGGDEGDDEDGGATAAEEAPSKQEYVAAADRICTEADIRFQRAFGGAEERSDPGAREAFVTEALVPIYRHMFDELQGLTPPEGDEEAVGEIYDKGEQGVDQIEDDPSAFLESGRSPSLDEAAGLATEYGFEVCGAQGS
jgi:hypothetical protein